MLGAVVGLHGIVRKEGRAEWEWEEIVGEDRPGEGPEGRGWRIK